MRIRRLAVVLAAGIAALEFHAAHAAVLIHVDKAAQTMTVLVDGQERYIWKVSTGMAAYDTPDGQFQAFRMERDHFSREWDDAPMPYSIFFTQEGHAIHGSYDIKHIGRPASHGCVRLAKENAAVLFDLVKEQGLKNTRVVLTGEIPGGAAAMVARRERPARYADDDDDLQRQRVRTVRGWREYQKGPRYYYYREDYRERAYVPPRRYEFYRPPFPFGW